MELQIQIIMSKSHENTSLTIFPKLKPEGQQPQLMTFDSTSVGVICVTVLKDHCGQLLWKYIKVCDLTMLGSHNATPPRDHCVQLPWKYIKYLDRVIIFQKKIN